MGGKAVGGALATLAEEVDEECVEGTRWVAVLNGDGVFEVAMFGSGSYRARRRHFGTCSKRTMMMVLLWLLLLLLLILRLKLLLKLYRRLLTSW